MPIKFRCPHCQQFLGISRARAGAITDCPMCGRAIRVPLLDGSTPALPEPELNLGDQRLASALDKLAGLAAGGAGAEAAAVVERVAAADPGPVALPEPLEVQPAPAPVIVVAEPQPRITVAPAAVEASVRAPESVLATLAESAPSSRGAIPFGAEAAVTRDRGGRQLAIAGACVLAAFAAGYGLGRRHASVAAPAPSAPVPAVVAAPAAAPVAPAGEPAVSGRITYVGPDGDVRPDAGARILVLPEERQGTAKLAADGFRAGASTADLRLAVASLRALGGDFAIAGADGQYSATLPQAGLFQLLIVSRYQPRAENAPVDAAALQLLERYFDRAPQVVGDAAMHLSQFRYRGSGASTRDQTFERP